CGLGLDQSSGRNVQAIWNRSAFVAAQCGIVSRLCLYRRAAQTCGWPFRPRSRQRRARAGRILRDRIVQPKSSKLRRRGDVVRPVFVRAGEVSPSPDWRISEADRDAAVFASTVCVWAKIRCPQDVFDSHNNTARVILNKAKDLTYLLAIAQSRLRDNYITCEVLRSRPG